MNSKNIIKVIPIPNNNFVSNAINITTPINDNNFDFTHTGNYEISCSSYANNDTQAYNAFNSLNDKYWQCNFNGNKDKRTPPYIAYSKHPYTNSNNNSINSSYQGGGSTNTTWVTKIKYKRYPTYENIYGEWIQIKLPEKKPEDNPIYLYNYSILTPKPSNRINTFPTRFMVVGSNDDDNEKNWEYIDQQNLYPLDTSVQRPIIFNINSPYSYSYFRLIIIEMPAKNSVVRINQWALNFLAYSTINKEAFSNLNQRRIEMEDSQVSNVNFHGHNLEYAKWDVPFQFFDDLNLQKNDTYYNDPPFNNNLKYLSYNTSNPLINKEESNSPFEKNKNLNNDIIIPIICLSILAISIIFYNKKNG
jgi:hypothetical protein